MRESPRADRVVLARESRGLTQRDLAVQLDIPQARLSRIEAGVKEISGELVESLSRVLHYPGTFFSRSFPILGSQNDLYHRKRRSTSVRVLREVYANLNIRRWQIENLLRSVDYECEVPSFPIEDYGDPQQVARAVRAAWLVPPGPIRDLTALVEAAFGVVVSFDFGTTQIDAVSLWVNGLPPIVFMNPALPRSRYRWTLAHELGHLVMHGYPNPHMEDEANEFAAEFLMPADEIRRDLRAVTLDRLLSLKLEWGTSVQALLMHAQRLGKIDSRRSKSLWIEISRKGLRKNEPYEDEIPESSPKLVQQLIDLHRDELHFSIEDLAVATDTFADEFRRVFLPATSGALRVIRAV